MGMGTSRAVGFLALVIAATTAAPAEAQYGPQPPNQIFYQSSTIARLNPLGLISRFQLQYRRRLYQSNSVFVRNNYVGFGVVAQGSPAFGRVGGVVEIAPVPMLVLRASYEAVGYFGTFEFMNSYADPSADFSDSAQDDNRDADGNYAAFGHELTLGAIAQIKLGPVAIRNNLRVIRGDYDLRGGDSYYYDPIYDTLSEDGGWMLTDDLDLLYQHQTTWTAGIRYTITAPFYSGDVSGTPADDNGPFDRLGFVVAYTHFQEYKQRFNGPTVLLLMQWYLRHRWRTGEDVSQALPQIVLGFDFRGDLMARPTSVIRAEQRQREEERERRRLEREREREERERQRLDEEAQAPLDGALEPEGDGGEEPEDPDPEVEEPEEDPEEDPTVEPVDPGAMPSLGRGE